MEAACAAADPHIACDGSPRRSGAPGEIDADDRRFDPPKLLEILRSYPEGQKMRQSHGGRRPLAEKTYRAAAIGSPSVPEDPSAELHFCLLWKHSGGVVFEPVQHNVEAAVAGMQTGTERPRLHSPTDADLELLEKLKSKLGAVYARHNLGHLGVMLASSAGKGGFVGAGGEIVRQTAKDFLEDRRRQRSGPKTANRRS